MQLKIKTLQRKDYRKAIQFAQVGMHFNQYMDSPWLVSLYTRYFWYQELLKATKIIAVYDEHQLAGVLLAKMKGEQPQYHSFWNRLYVKFFELVEKYFSKDVGESYEDANARMLARYQSEHDPDGEILFLAANPEIQAKGIGSTLLNEFERQVAGKQIFLYTDSGCTYQFYDHRDFTRFESTTITTKTKKQQVKLDCFLYGKQVPVK
jgi:GNAT superfamily N-acetyltransferase